MSTFLTAFTPHKPSAVISQASSREWLKAYYTMKSGQPGKAAEVDTLVDRYAVPEEQVRQRYSYMGEGLHSEWDRNQVFNAENRFNPDLSSRNARMEKVTDQIFGDLYGDADSPPNHILHVSCTHYKSPSGAQRLAGQKGWHSDTSVTHLYHMGCYAALPAIRTARALNSENAKRVYIVHTEFCTFHVKPEDLTPEQVIIQTLFADGAIRYEAKSRKQWEKDPSPAMEILGMHEIMVPDTEDEMTWAIRAHHFDMTLSARVPLAIGRKLKNFAEDLFERSGLDFAKHKDDTDFAIHPGGPKIIRFARDILELEDDQIRTSSEVLADRGNMSSATLPHIWKKQIEESERRYVFTAAFGPGLTMTGALLKLHR